MKLKNILIIASASLMLMSGNCNSGNGQNNTTPDGTADPSSVNTLNSFLKLGEADFYCDFVTLDNPCNLVLNGVGKIEVRVVGTNTSWEQINQYVVGSFPYPSFQHASSGTQVNGNNQIFSDGCVQFEYPQGEDFNIYITLI